MDDSHPGCVRRLRTSERRELAFSKAFSECFLKLYGVRKVPDRIVLGTNRPQRDYSYPSTKSLRYEKSCYREDIKNLNCPSHFASPILYTQWKKVREIFPKGGKFFCEYNGGKVFGLTVEQSKKNMSGRRPEIFF